MANKKGSEKYYIIISLILGLMVLSLGLFFIFNEFFTEGEIDWQRCRQSILLRASMPVADLEVLKLDIKGSFPLKCRTEVVTIDSAEPEEIYGKISETIATGWYMFGEGEFEFIHSSFLEKDVICLAFARIHYTSGAIKEFNEDYFSEEALREFAREKSLEGDIEDFLSTKMNYDFYDYYRRIKVPGTRNTYDEYLPLVLFAKEGIKKSFIPFDVNFYPNEEDLIVIYTMTNKKGWFKQLVYSVKYTYFNPQIFHYLWSGDEMGLIEYLGIERTIILVSPGDIDALGCKFLTIPA